MKPRKILRRKEAMSRLGCGKTKFSLDYEFHDEADPNIPGADIPRVRALNLGPVNRGFLEHEIDALIDALAKAGGHSESKAKNLKAAREALRDATPPTPRLAQNKEARPGRGRASQTGASRRHGVASGGSL